MAWEQPCFKISCVAGEDMSAKQYHFVKMSANNTVIGCAAVTDKPIGVLQNDPVSGDAAEILVIGVSKVQVGAAGALAFGDSVATDGDGHAEASAPGGGEATHYAIGQCIEGAAAGAIASAFICCVPNRNA